MIEWAMDGYSKCCIMVNVKYIHHNTTGGFTEEHLQSQNGVHIYTSGDVNSHFVN